MIELVKESLKGHYIEQDYDFSNEFVIDGKAIIRVVPSNTGLYNDKELYPLKGGYYSYFYY